MKRIFLSILALLVIIGGVSYYYKQHKKQAENNQQSQNNLPVQQPVTPQTAAVTPPSPQTAVPPKSNVKTYTMAEVAKHDQNADTCWTVIHDKVYDLTDFMDIHPGGHQIMVACGIDGTKLFETRPMGSKTPHSAKAREIMKKYYLGDLQK
jgi:cytochrome b involved in lipid metabolism